jgi:hypothetical protein
MRFWSRTIAAGLLATGIQAACVDRPLHAQAIGYGVSPGWTFEGGGTSYVPYGGGFGGFIPQRSMSGAAVRPMGGMVEPYARSPIAGMGVLGGMGTGLGAGASRALSAPVGPLRLSGAGMGGAMTRPSGGSASPMGAMGRPPVGYYPFRVPPNFSTSGSGPRMAM